MPSLFILSAERPDIVCPENTMLPFVGLINPVRQLKSVVLPAPFGPMMLRMVLSVVWKLISSIALMPPKCLERALTSSGYTLTSEQALGPEYHKNNQTCS